MTLNDILLQLIQADTNQLIAEIANAFLKDFAVMAKTPKAFGIIILAVDDAKTSGCPLSQNPLYCEVFYKTKKLLNETIT